MGLHKPLMYWLAVFLRSPVWPALTCFDSQHICLVCFYRVMPVVNRTGGAGKIIDLINFCVKWLCHIIAYKFKIWITQQVTNVVLLACKPVIHTNNVISFSDQSVT